jgi:hypothetical protein
MLQQVEDNIMDSPKSKKSEKIPSWFKGSLADLKKFYTEGIESEEKKKAAQKHVQKSVKETFQNPVTKDKLQSTVNSHKQKLVSMIFPGRQIVVE